MSRCPNLDYESVSFFGNSDDKYICKVTGVRMDADSAKVEHLCKGSYDAYYDCPIYKNS